MRFKKNNETDRPFLIRLSTKCLANDSHAIRAVACKRRQKKTKEEEEEEEEETVWAWGARALYPWTRSRNAANSPHRKTGSAKPKGENFLPTVCPVRRSAGPAVHRTAALLTSPKSKLSIKFVITDGKSVGKRFLMTRWDGQVHMWNKWEISTESRFLKNGSQESNVVSEAVAKPWPTFDALSPTWTASLFFVHLSPRVNRYACL